MLQTYPFSLNPIPIYPKEVPATPTLIPHPHTHPYSTPTYRHFHTTPRHIPPHQAPLPHTTTPHIPLHTTTYCHTPLPPHTTTTTHHYHHTPLPPHATTTTHHHTPLPPHTTTTTHHHHPSGPPSLVGQTCRFQLRHHIYLSPWKSQLATCFTKHSPTPLFCKDNRAYRTIKSCKLRTIKSP